MTVFEVRKTNEELAHRINQEARSDPTSPYSGKRVGIANGQVVVVAETWDEVVRRLHEVETNPERMFCLQAGMDAQEVFDIGECL